MKKWRVLNWAWNDGCENFGGIEDAEEIDYVGDSMTPIIAAIEFLKHSHAQDNHCSLDAGSEILAVWNPNGMCYEVRVEYEPQTIYTAFQEVKD